MQNGMPKCGVVHTAIAAMALWWRAPWHWQPGGRADLTGLSRSFRRSRGHFALETQTAFASPMRDVLEVVPVAILGIDKAGRIAFINEKASALFGYRSDELAGAWASLLIPEWRMHGSCAMAGKPPSGASLLRTAIARRHDGTEFSAEMTMRSCRVDSVPTRIVVIVERSERNELHRNQQELAHLARISALGELAGSLAHELNQPLTAILSNSQAAQRFMEADPINVAEVRETLDDIVADNRRAGEIIRKMRTLVRKGDMEWQRVDVGGVVHDVVSLVHSDAIVRAIRTTLDVEPALPPVRGDKVQLQQVLLNLMLNAFDAVQDRPASDRLVTVQARTGADGSVCLCVRDCGHGLTVEQLDKIFQPFFTSKPHGLGLGLSISRSIVSAHGGHIWAENNAEGGATFHVLLPSGQTAEPHHARVRP